MSFNAQPYTYEFNVHVAQRPILPCLRVWTHSLIFCFAWNVCLLKFFESGSFFCFHLYIYIYTHTHTYSGEGSGVHIDYQLTPIFSWCNGRKLECWNEILRLRYQLCLCCLLKLYSEFEILNCYSLFTSLCSVVYYGKGAIHHFLLNSLSFVISFFSIATIFSKCWATVGCWKVCISGFISQKNTIVLKV